SGAAIDSIGQAGFDPGTEWGTGLTSTADNTLRRKATIETGDAAPTDAFDPSLEWDGFATDTFDGLGCAGSTACGPPPPSLGACGDGAETSIHMIQGSGLTSPVVGAQHVIEGVVGGDFEGTSGLNGFFVQEEDADADADPLTSEGLFVFFPASPGVQAGDLVRVLGTVTEFNGLTEITTVTGSAICSSGNSVTASSASLPLATSTSLEPLEGMLTSFAQTLTATETFTLGRFGEVVLSSGGRLFTPTQIVAPGAPAIAMQAANDLNRIQLDDGSNTQNPAVVPYLAPDNTLRIGDTIAGVTGVLSFGFGAYELHPTGSVAFVRANARPTGPPAVGGSLRIGASNVLNYFTTLDTGPPVCGPLANLDCRGANSVLEFDRQRAKLVSALTKLDADIVGLTELENNATDAPIADLVAGLNDATAAGTYAYIATGAIGTDAIRVGIVYKPAEVTPVGAYAILDSSVDPQFIDTKSRPVLAQSFRENGTDDVLTVAVNHLKSKGSDCNDVGDPDTGDGQGNCNLTRTSAADALVDWLAADPTASGSPDRLIIGDLNSYAQEDPIAAIESAGYTNLVGSLVGAGAYSFVFQAQSGTLDYALASPSLAAKVVSADEYHVNADEPIVLDYNTEFGRPPVLFNPDEFRAADHDPVLVGICEGTRPELTVSASPSRLFPPNHKYVTVQVSIAASDQTPPTVTLLSATSSEPDNAPGGADGNTRNDAVIVDLDTVRLRAERNENGSGRTYTLTYRARDACGNTTVQSATVFVPIE
ncbi:MAG: ExeM/NucH family extracellular endonuclease, partial [Gaiellaceae bacterium]